MGLAKSYSHVLSDEANERDAATEIITKAKRAELNYRPGETRRWREPALIE
jgi:hypothetical protein